MSDLIDVMEALKSINKSAEDALSGSYQDKERELENVKVMSTDAAAILRKHMWKALNEDITKTEQDLTEYIRKQIGGDR